GGASDIVDDTEGLASGRVSEVGSSQSGSKRAAEADQTELQRHRAADNGSEWRERPTQSRSPGVRRDQQVSDDDDAQQNLEAGNHPDPARERPPPVLDLGLAKPRAQNPAVQQPHNGD